MEQSLKDRLDLLNSAWSSSISRHEAQSSDVSGSEDLQDYFYTGDSTQSDRSTISSGLSLGGSPLPSPWPILPDEWLNSTNDTIDPFLLLGQDAASDNAVDGLIHPSLALNPSNIFGMTDFKLSNGDELIHDAIPNPDLLLGDDFNADPEPLPAPRQDDRLVDTLKADLVAHRKCAPATRTRARRPSVDMTDLKKDVEETSVTRHNGTKPKHRAKETQANGKRPSRALPHCVVEKRYRKKLIDTFADLRAIVPSTRVLVGDVGDDVEALGEARKWNKASVMGRAAAYIRHLEKQNKTLTNELDKLRA